MNLTINVIQVSSVESAAPSSFWDALDNDTRTGLLSRFAGRRSFALSDAIEGNELTFDQKRECLQWAMTQDHSLRSKAKFLSWAKKIPLD